jgi:Family of unknown function (DUF6941)
MTIAEQTKVLRFFAVDLTLYPSYEDVRLVVERSDPVPLRVRELPYEAPALSVFATLMLGPNMLDGGHRVALEWVGIGGNVEARHEEELTIPDDVVVSGPFSISFVVNFQGLRFSAPGTYESRLILDGETVETLPVEVVIGATEL